MATFTATTRSLTNGTPDDIALSNPAFGDIDGDGLVDLIVGNTRDSLRFFKNTGTTTDPAFTERTGTSTDPFASTKLTDSDAAPNAGNGGFVSLVDIDGDSDLDLFHGSYVGNVFYYRNDDPSLPGNPQNNPTFSGTATFKTQGTSAPNTPNTVFGLDLDSADANNKFITPTFVDIDGDGDQDLFIGRYDAIDYYENTGASNAPAFTKNDSANPFSSTTLTVTSGGVSGGKNRPNVAFAKLNGRTVFDAFVGSEDGTIRYFKNNGTTTAPNLTEVTGTDNPFNGYTAPDGEGRPALSFADIDNDGIIDAAVGSQSLINFSAGAIGFFEEVPSTATTLANSSGGTFTFGNASNGANLALQLTGNTANQITNVTLALAGGATQSLFSVHPSALLPTAFANDSSLTNRTFVLQNTAFTSGQSFTLSFDLLNGSTVSSSQVTATETSSGSGVWTLGVDSDGDGTSDLTFSVFQTNNLPDSNGVGTGTTTATTQLNGGAEIFEVAAATTGSFTLYREADFNNVVGFYQIDDASGAVGGIAPGASGYAQAAINNRVTGADLQVGNQSSTTVSGVSLTAGLFAPFIVVDGTVSDFLAGGKTAYFAYSAANDDGQDHILLLGNNLFGFEDLSGGGDFDYNDLIIQADFT